LLLIARLLLIACLLACAFHSFWVQIAGSQSTELDFIVDAMTDYYNDKTNQKLHQIREPYLGQIGKLFAGSRSSFQLTGSISILVAAMFFADNKWYRAEIIAIQPNESMPNELVLDVYFLDYGDSQFVGKKDILELRTDFLSLRFQAIECFLAHIQPASGGSKLDEWDEKAVEKFEQMVQVAQWKKLISKVVTYKERKSFALQRQSKQRESSPIPGVELYDPEENVDRNIALELVQLGYAEMSDRFGDLKTKSAILNPSEDELRAEKDASPPVVVASPSQSAPIKEISPEPVKEASPPPPPTPSPSKPKKELPVASPEAVVSEPVKVQTPPATPAAANNEDKVLSVANGDSTKKKQQQPEPTDLFANGKPTKAKKKQQLNDFLMNEQQATSKKSPVKQDWNEMLDE